MVRSRAASPVGGGESITLIWSDTIMYRIGKSRKAEEVPRLPPLIGRG
jgi:hypothetical protein